MGRLLVKHEGLACLWSTVMDAPVSNFVDYDKLKAEEPTLREEELTYFIGRNRNRAGPNESSITSVQRMLKLYEDDGNG